MQRPDRTDLSRLPRRQKLGEIIKNVRLTPEVYDFTSDDGIRHEVWRIDKMSTIVDISKIFEAIPHLYIADGHHRAASAVKVGLKRRAEDLHFSGTEEYNYFLSVLFPADELAIYDYNRVVTDMNGYTFEQFLDTIKSRFDVALAGVEAVRPQKKGEFGMYADGNWYRVNAKSRPFLRRSGKRSGCFRFTGSHPFPGSGHQRSQNRFPHPFYRRNPGLDALKDAADQTGGIAFAMYPTSMTELMGVADAGLLMPPKSTWFEPKLRSGLFIHRFLKYSNKITTRRCYSWKEMNSVGAAAAKKYKKCHMPIEEKKFFCIQNAARLFRHGQSSKRLNRSKKIKESARLNTAVLDEVAKAHPHRNEHCRDRRHRIYVHERTRGNPAPLNYQGFPKSVCTSLNNEICHGIPDKNIILQDGDIINVDVSTILNGYFSDASRMFKLGTVSERAEKIVRVTEECVNLGLAAAKPWGTSR